MGGIHLLVLVAAAAASAPIGAESSRRFLLLHGTGSSAGAFVNSPTARGAKEFLSGVPRRVDANSILVPPNWQYMAIDACNSDGDWWSGGDSFTGIGASIAAVEDAVVSSQSVGIIGHEQGGTIAALVAARSALGLGPPLKFAICCGASMPDSGPYAELLHKLRDTADASIPTLHCISKSSGNDPLPERAEALAACFAPSAEILWHDRGSGMPPLSWWEQTRGFPERVTGGNRWVTQFAGPFYYKNE